jgi:hypothetical protein
MYGGGGSGLIQVTATANGVQINATFKERNPTGSLIPLNLTGKTVNLNLKRSTGLATVTGTITNAANGEATFTLSSSVLDVGGETYKTEFEIIDGTNKFYEPGPDIYVRAKLA